MSNPDFNSAVHRLSNRSAARDERLDFWRALCLIDMVLVHLIYVAGVDFGILQRTIGEYTRFAAGGFVFVAGLSIGVIFLPKTFKEGGRRKVYRSLSRRAFYILCVHFAATLSFVPLDIIMGMRTDAPPILPLMRDVLLFREGGDLLPLYVIMVAVSPLLLELLRRRMWWLIAAMSAFLFLWGQNHPWFLSTPIHQNFPVILWQAIFVGGLLFGLVLPKYSAMRWKWKCAWLCIVTGISLTLWAGDFRSEVGWSWPVLPLSFVKAPLSVGEALRYFGLIFIMVFATDLTWKKIAGSKLVSLVTTMGRRSLAVYVTHVWVVGLLALVVWKTTRFGAWQMVLVIPAVGAMWGVARGLEWWNDRDVSTIWQSRWVPLPLSIAAGAMAVLVLGWLGMGAPAPVVPDAQPQFTGWMDRDASNQTDVPDDRFFDPQDSDDIMTA